jgi:hypothetical protein
MPFLLLIAQCKVQNIIGSRILVCFGRGAFLVFPFLSTMRLPKYPWILKQMLLFLGVFAIFCTQVFFFCKFHAGQGCFVIYKKKRKKNEKLSQEKCFETMLLPY